MIRIGSFFFRHRNALFPVVYSLLFLRSPRLLASPLFAGIAGFVVAGAGQALRAITIGSEYIPRGGKGGQVHAKTLVQGGIYAHCRNPLYLGNLLILLGLGLASNSVLFLVVAVPFFCFAYRAIAAVEEAYLREKFGEEYVAYCGRVNRLIPSLSGVRENLSETRFSWRRFLSAEHGPTYLWLAALLLVILKNVWLAGDYRWGNPLVKVLWTLLVLVTLAYGLARYLKKTGRLKEATPA
jgi:protein-S-isoprenylcysteine O-methyltransferase Ste14